MLLFCWSVIAFCLHSHTKHYAVTELRATGNARFDSLEAGKVMYEHDFCMLRIQNTVLYSA